MELDWAEILEITKNAKLQVPDDPKAFLKRVESYFQPCYEQFSRYALEISREKADSVLDSASMKRLVLQTRAALRFGLCCHSVEAIESSSEGLVTSVQSSVVVEHQWHNPLANLLTYRRGDKKCRTFAAQLMSNLVTSNAKTASIVSSSIQIAPSAESISTSILESVPCEDDDEVSSSKSPRISTANWVDMILSAAKSGNREAVAAIAAALHNCISSMMPMDENATQTEENRSDFVETIASNGLIVSTLLRNFVSAEAVTKAIENEKSGSKEQSGHWDAATDWIQLLLSRLAKLGMLPKMFTSIDAGLVRNSSGSSSIRLMPEQNILLQCMSREANAYAMEYTTNRGVQNPIGNAACVFLAELLVQMSPWFRDQRIPNNETNQHDRTSLDGFNDQLVHSGFLTVIEILATILGVDTPEITALRLLLGQDSAILQESAKCLGVVLDDLAEKSEGRKARDIKLSDDDQKILTSLVQFVGNMCYDCKHNQDLLRTTLVPRAKPLLPRIEESAENVSNDADIRNGLHVLLTCTTHATACFTLREWGVIAIRNVLEENTENQSVVKDLMAQGPVESADLEEAGVRVQLDSKGKVSLATIDESSQS